jgi:hypothetical protein
MKLTLRELFLLVALAAMGCGWWLDHNVLRIGVGMSEESRRAAMATMERMKLSMESEGFRREPSSQTMVRMDSP